MSQRVFFRKGEPKLPRLFHYTASDLPNVYLENGVTFYDEGEDGMSFEIADVEALHTLIAACIVIRFDRFMTGPELRFLRKLMRKTQVDIAAVLHISDQSISNYEKGITPISGPVDFSMRVMFAFSVLPGEAAIALMGTIAGRVARHMERPQAADLPDLSFSSWAEAA